MAASTSRASAPPSRTPTARITTPADPPRPAGTPPVDSPVAEQQPADHAAAPLPALATSRPASRPFSGLVVNDTFNNEFSEAARDPVPNSEPDLATTKSSPNVLTSLADVTATALAPTLSDADLFPGYSFDPPEVSPPVLAARALLPPVVRARFPERKPSPGGLRPLHAGKVVPVPKCKRSAPPPAPAPTPVPPEPTSSTHAVPTLRAPAKPAIQKRRAVAPTPRTAPPAPSPDSDASRRAAALASLMASIQDLRAHKPPSPTRAKSPVPLSALTATPATPGLHRRLQSNQIFLRESQVALEAKQTARDTRWAAIRANVAAEFAALRMLPPVPAAPAAPTPLTQLPPAKVDSGVLPDLDEEWNDPVVPASAIATVDVASIRQHYIPLPRRRTTPRTTANLDPAGLPDLATCPHLHASPPPAPLTSARRACKLAVTNTGTNAVRVHVHPVDVVWADHVSVEPQVRTLFTGQTLAAPVAVVGVPESETVRAAVVVQVDDVQYVWRVNVEPDRFEPECSVDWVVPALGPLGAVVCIENAGLTSGTVDVSWSHPNLFAIDLNSIMVEPHGKAAFRVFAETNETTGWPSGACIQLSSDGAVWHSIRVLPAAPSTTPRPDSALTLTPIMHDLGLLPLTRPATHTLTLRNRKSHAVRFSATASGTHARADPSSGFVQRLATHPIAVHLTGTVAGPFDATVTVRGNGVPPMTAKVGGTWYDPAFEARAAVDLWNNVEVGSEVMAMIRVTNPSPVAVDVQVRAENAISRTSARGKAAELDPDDAGISSDDDDNVPHIDPHTLHIPAHASAVTRILVRVPSNLGAWRATVTVTSRDHAVRITLHGHATAPVVKITPHTLVLPPASASFRATGAFDLVWAAPNRIVHHDLRATTTHPVEATFEIGMPESIHAASAAALRIYPIRGTVREGGHVRVHVFYSPPPPVPPTPAPPAAASPPPPADLAASRRFSLLPSAAKPSGARRSVADTDNTAVSAASTPAVQTRTDAVVRVPVRITPTNGGHGNGKRAEVQWVTVAVSAVSPAFTLSLPGNAPAVGMGPLVIDVGPVPLGTTATATIAVISHLPRSPLDVHVRANPAGHVALMHAVRPVAPLAAGTVALAVTPERDGAFTAPVELFGASTRARMEVRGVAYAPAITVTTETRLGNIWAHEALAAAIASVVNGAAHAVPWTVTDAGSGAAAVRAVPPTPIPGKGTAQVMLDIPATPTVPTAPCSHAVRVAVTGAPARQLCVTWTPRTLGMVLDGAPIAGPMAVRLVATWTRGVRGRGAKRGSDVWRLTVPGVQVTHVRAPAGAKVDTKRAPVAGSFTATAAAVLDAGAGWALEPATGTVEPGSSVDVRVVPPPPVGVEWVEVVQGVDGGSVYVAPPMRDGPPGLEGAVVPVAMVGGFDAETRKMVPDTAPKVWEVHVVVEVVDEEGKDGLTG